MILNVISRIRNKKHKAIIAIGFACGLRISEAVSIKLSDFDKSKGILYVRGKGNKERIVPVESALRLILKDYYLEYKPYEYLFEGSNGNYSTASVAKVIKKYFGPKFHFHLLRHSFATLKLENGVDPLNHS